MITEVVFSTSRPAARGATRTLRSGFALTALAMVSALFFMGPAQPAGAAGSPSVSVSPSSGLDPNGAFVVVSGSGFKPNLQLFVMQCRNNSGEDHTCNSIGLQKISTDGSGNFSGARVKVIGYFGSTDCAQTPCAVKTSAVSGHSGDRSQDVLAPLSFGAAPTPQPTAPPATQPPATQPSPPQPPVTAPPSTEAATATTTTTTTTTEAPSDEATTTTTEASVDGSPATPTTTSPSKVTELVAGTDTTTRSGDDDGSSPVPWIVAGLVVVLGAIGGGIYTLRSRAAR